MNSVILHLNVYYYNPQSPIHYYNMQIAINDSKLYYKFVFYFYFFIYSTNTHKHTSLVGIIIYTFTLTLICLSWERQSFHCCNQRLQHK